MNDINTDQIRVLSDGSRWQLMPDGSMRPLDEEEPIVRARLLEDGTLWQIMPDRSMVRLAGNTDWE